MFVFKAPDCVLYHQPHEKIQHHGASDPSTFTYALTTYLHLSAFEFRFCPDIRKGLRVHPPPQFVNDNWGFPDEDFEEIFIPPKPIEALKKAETRWQDELVEEYKKLPPTKD